MVSGLGSKGVESRIWDIISSALASLISIGALKMLGFNRSANLTTHQYVQFFLLIVGAIVLANYLAEFDRVGLSAVTIIGAIYFFGHQTIWTLSSQEAMASPRLQGALLLFALAVAGGGAILGVWIPSTFLESENSDESLQNLF